MKVLIREGSAARNFDALIPALASYSKHIMFCSDDKHPDSLLVGHINQLCARAVALGYDVFDVLQAACVNPVLHYGVPVGLLRVGDAADFIVADNLTEFTINQTVINGQTVAQHGTSFIASSAVTPINKFAITPITVDALAYNPQTEEHVI